MVDLLSHRRRRSLRVRFWANERQSRAMAMILMRIAITVEGR